MTRVVLHSVEKRGDAAVVSLVDPGSKTTREMSMGLVRKLMDLQDRAAPGSINQLAADAIEMGLMQELLSEVVEPRSALGSPSKKVDMKNPRSVMEGFYAASILQNEQAAECHVFVEKTGGVIGMAQLGRFSMGDPGTSGESPLRCTISNLSLSPEADAVSHQSMMRTLAMTANTKFGEASLMTPEPWAHTYTSHGFLVEKLSESAPDGKDYMVKCRWES